MACGHCGRPWIVSYAAVARGCYCHWHVGRVEKPRGNSGYIAPPTGPVGGWDWLARVYNEATQ